MTIHPIIERIIQISVVALPALITILNPVTAATTLTSVTEGMNSQERVHVARKAAMTSFWVLVIFAFGGAFIFNLFDITIGAFQIAGGIILFMVGIDTRADEASPQKEGVEVREDYSIVPLAIPLISGPGAITTVLILTGELKSFWETFVIMGCLLVSMLCIYLAMRYSVTIFKVLGEGGMRILTRVMGLIIAVVGIQFVINGIQSLIPTIVPMIKQYL